MALGKKTGGRVKGVPNKGTSEVKALALKYCPAAMKRLAYLSIKAKSEQAQVAACNSIIDRAVGKPAQSIDLTNSDGTLSQVWRDALKQVDEEIQEASVQH